MVNVGKPYQEIPTVPQALKQKKYIMLPLVIANKFENAYISLALFIASIAIRRKHTTEFFVNITHADKMKCHFSNRCLLSPEFNEIEVK